MSSALRTCCMLALAAMTAAPLRAEPLWSDPLRTMHEVSTTPVSAAYGVGCSFAARLPDPLTLLDAVERALCRNPQTRQAWANVKVQAAALGTSRAAYLPSLTAAGS